MDVQCFHCLKSTSQTSKIGFRDECLHCRSDLHVCKNCDFYDTKSYNECREPAAEIVKEKDRANYCEYFVCEVGRSKAQDQKEKLKAAAESLFKKQT